MSRVLLVSVVLVTIVTLLVEIGFRIGHVGCYIVITVVIVHVVLLFRYVGRRINFVLLASQVFIHQVGRIDTLELLLHSSLSLDGIIRININIGYRCFRLLFLSLLFDGFLYIFRLK